MEIRLNKLLSDAGLCSRREADKFIEMGRVTVNGKQPEVGQKVSKADIVMLDDIKVNFSQAQEHASATLLPKWRKKKRKWKTVRLLKKRNLPVPAVS